MVLPPFLAIAQIDTLSVGEYQQIGEGNDKVANIAFNRVDRTQVVGAISTINASVVNKFDNNIWLSSALAGRTQGMLGGTNIRGIGIGLDVGDITGSGSFSGNAMFVVDGLPRDINGLRLSEIESITILKDVNSAILYGSAAINGVVLITTKRGEANKPKSNFSVNYGLQSPRALPKYLNSADYMRYFNIARVNDGLTPQFSEEMINNYQNGNKYRYPSTDYYSGEYLRPFKSYYDVNAEFSGGDRNARFYSNVGWNSAGGLLNFGQGANARNNQFNVRGNVDLKVNRWIETSVDAAAIYGVNKGPTGNYWSNAATLRPHEYTPLLPFDLIDPENALFKGRKNDVDGKYLLGGTSAFTTTPFGEGYSGGVVENITRKFTFNNRINFDLSSVTPGLSAQTNMSFDYYTQYAQTVDNEYSVYTPTWSATEDRIVSLVQHGRDARPGTQVVGGSFFRRRFGFYGQLKYNREVAENHRLYGQLIAFGSNYKEQGDFQGTKNAHAALQLGYAYKNRYLVDFSSSLVNSVKLPEGNRVGFAPSLGLSWIASQEDFLKDHEIVDFLKLRLSGGILKSDVPVGDFFYYDNRYTTSGSYNWYEGVRSRSGVISSWSSNPKLSFAKRNEINLGIETQLFNRAVGIDLNLFYERYSDLIVRPSTRYPSFYTNFVGYENFEADEYRGLDLGITYNKSKGDWNFMVGANLLYVTSQRKRVDEVWDFDYLNRTGRPKDATFGLEALGLFKDQDEINNSPIQTFGTVKPGDIKYKDQNNDGIINANDEVYLRRYQAPLSAGLQFRVGYKRLNLFVLGEGRQGVQNFRENNYFWVDANKKYSEVVLNSWTPTTAETATHPRLSTQTNSNNHRRSSYWLYSDDYFSIRRVQLTYDLPAKVADRLLMSNLNVFASANDLIQFAPNRAVREISIGGEPQYRTFSIGVRASFK